MFRTLAIATLLLTLGACATDMRTPLDPEAQVPPTTTSMKAGPKPPAVRPA
nr:hypothetical protein [uncultured Sphingomonas sp.]